MTKTPHTDFARAEVVRALGEYSNGFSSLREMEKAVFAALETMKDLEEENQRLHAHDLQRAEEYGLIVRKLRAP